jgi:hypothetical protein
VATARAMAGQRLPYADAPWFWSDQYDVNIQVLGDPTDGELVLRGDPASSRFTAISLRDGRIGGAVTVNRRPDMAALRKILAAGQKVQRADLENPTFDLRRVPASA